MIKYLLFSFTGLQILSAALLTPTDNADLSHIHVLFSWEEIDGVSTYQIQVSKDLDFGETLISKTTENNYYIEKEMISWENSYYWRVKPLGGDWIDSFSFTTMESSVTFQSDEKPIEILVNNPSKTYDGLTMFGSYYNNYSAAIDMNGNEVWNSGGINSFVFFQRDKNQRLLGGKFLPELNSSLIGAEFNLENGIVWTEPVDPSSSDGESFIQHEIVVLPNGNYMGFIPVIEKHPIPTYTKYETRTTPFSWEDKFEDLIEIGVGWDWKSEKIVEWDKDSGEIVWEWNAFDYFSIDDFDYLAGHWENAWDNNQPFDWVHFNALAYQESEHALYVSSRHLDRITKIDYNTKNVIWNVGIPWLGDSTVIQPDQLFSGQHGLQVLPNGNIVTFDNGILSEFMGADYPTSTALELNISEENGELKASTVWSFSLPDTLYGALSGNAHKLPNGNFFITTIGNVAGAYSVEVTPSKEIVWMCKYNLGNYDTGPLYRAMRIPGLFKATGDFLSNEVILHPENIQLLTAYPNPFNPEVTLKYKVMHPEYTKIDILDLTGRKIDNLKEGFHLPGNYEIIWDGSTFSSGMYLVRFSSGQHTTLNKIHLIK
jgi:hypothetical protein